MTGHIFLAVPLAFVLALLTGGTATAAEQRRCKTDFAVFPRGNQQRVVLQATVEAGDTSARVRVDGSGEWSGRRTRLASGADTVVFDSGPAIETLTIGVGGALLWEIAYRDRVAGDGRVIAFIGMCKPWKAQ